MRLSSTSPSLESHRASSGLRIYPCSASAHWGRVRHTGQYVELVPNERLRYTDKFEDPNLPGEIQVTVTLKKVSFGTELNVVQEGLPNVIPLAACYLGWQAVSYTHLR